MFLWPLLSGVLFSNAQYSAPLAPLSSPNACDQTRLVRCQQDVLRDMQLAGLNAASIQYQLGSGPPYSPASVSKQQRESQLGPATCRLVRSNLDCLLSTTPACFEAGIQAAQNTDIILRAKRFIEQSGCNEPDTTWQGTFCYRSIEMKNCEDRYGFSAFSPTALTPNLTTCLAYQAYRHCVDSHLRLACKVHEMDMINEYLIDRSGELAWRCPAANSSTLHYAPVASHPYSSHSGPLLSPSSYGQHNYDQRLVPTYVGSSQSTNMLNPIRDQPWERFRSPLDETRYGISRFPATSTGEVFDRLVAGGASAFDPDTSDCPIKATPYAHECENTLLEQHRLARDSRDGNELQRRICCSLFQYRDCISRVVLDRCADSSPAAVEILMGMRRREMTITCRGFNRDFCSGAISSIIANHFVLLFAFLLATFMTLKQSTLTATIAL